MTGLAEGVKDGNWEKVTVEDGEITVVSTVDGEGLDVGSDGSWVVMVVDGTGIDVGSDGGGVVTLVDDENIVVANGMAELEEVLIVTVPSVVVAVGSNVLMTAVDVLMDISTDVSRVVDSDTSILGDMVVGVSITVKGDDGTTSDLVKDIALGVEMV